MSVDELYGDIKFLIGAWFVALEDEGGDPWRNKGCVDMANKYGYTREDYDRYLSTIC